MRAPRCEHRWVTRPTTVPEALLDVVLAIVRDRPLGPVARITTTRTVDMLYGPDGVALAEFCDDQVTAQADQDDAEQRWREWELELAEGGDRDLLDRLTNRLLDAGAEPAGHGSKLARVLDTAGTPEPEAPARPDDPVHRAVAEQVEQLLVWDRAVRADVYDSVHQMRVTTRKIRSLLQASEGAFGLTDDAWILDELRQLAAVLGVARDAEVLAERYEKALDEMPDELVRGPVRERLVDGAKRHYESGLAAVGDRDAVTALLPAARRARGARGRRAPACAAGRRACRADARFGLQEDPQGGEEGRATPRTPSATRRCTEFASAPSDFVTPQRRTGADKVSDRAKTIQSLLGDHQDSVVSRTHLSSQAEAAHAAGEDTFTYGLLFQQEDDLAKRSSEQLDAALKKLRRPRCANPARGGRVGL